MKGTKWKEDGQQEEAVETGLRIRPSPGFPSPPSGLSGRATRKGRCSRRSARRLTRHIITPSQLVPPRHPSSSVQLTAHPPAPPPVSSSSSTSSSSFSSHPDLFTLPSSPVATLRASIRAGQQPLRHPSSASRWGQYGRSSTLDTLQPRCLITQDTFLRRGRGVKRRAGERARAPACTPLPPLARKTCPA